MDSRSGGPKLQSGDARQTLARIGWVALAGIVVFTYSAAIPARITQMRNDPLGLGAALGQIGLSVEFFAVYTTILDSLVALALIAIAALIYWTKPGDRVAVVVSLAFLTLPVALLPLTSALNEIYPGWRIPILLFKSFSLTLTLAILTIFPDGRMVPRWSGWILILWLIHSLTWLFFPSLSPAPTPIETRTFAQWLSIFFLLIWYGFGLLAQAYRYTKVSNAAQRQQTKWVILGFAVLFAALVGISAPVVIIPAIRVPGIQRLVYLLIEIPIALAALTFLPVTFALSIQRYRLWDIDLVIRKTLVYGALTLTLSLIYGGGVILLQQIFRSISGLSDQLAIVLSTLGIAALFNPLRRRIQKDIELRFYRRQYDANRALEWFNAKMRSSRLCTPTCTFVTPNWRRWRTSSGVTQSGRVSTTSPTLR